MTSELLAQCRQQPGGEGLHTMECCLVPPNHQAISLLEPPYPAADALFDKLLKLTGLEQAPTYIVKPDGLALSLRFLDGIHGFCPR